MSAHSGSERAEQRRLREQMRGSGMSYAEVAAEMARRYRFRPRKAWRVAWGWTLEEAAERFNALRAKGAQEAVTSLTGSRLSEWENWPVSARRPSFLSLCLLAEVYRCPVLDLVDFRDRERLPPGELLALDKTGTIPPPADDSHDPHRNTRALGIGHSELAAGPAPGLTVAEAGAVSGLTGPQLDTGRYGAMPDWPAWFGLKLAQMITMTDTWQPSSQLGTLQTLLNEEILMSDAAVPGDERHLRLLHDVSRRQALMTLGALPMAMSGANLAAAPAYDTGDDLFLSRCAASLTACWHLLKGSDLAGVEQLITGYLLPLEAAALRPSRHRQAAAMLAAQAHRVCGIISLHRNQLHVREQHCKRALYLAEIGCDPSGHAAALISLASTYFYAGKPEAAAAVYEQVFQHGSALPQLQLCRVHAELSVVYGQLGREQDSVRANAQAETLYPERPEQDPSFLYAEFTPASLTLERGLGFVALAERFPGHSYARQAARIFKLGTAPDMAIPDRIRLEIVNHQARTAVLLSDLDAFEAFMHQGLDGVTQFASRQRLREMQATLRHARACWPAERRVTVLGDRVSNVAVAGELA